MKIDTENQFHWLKVESILFYWYSRCLLLQPVIRRAKYSVVADTCWYKTPLKIKILIYLRMNWRDLSSKIQWKAALRLISGQVFSFTNAAKKVKKPNLSCGSAGHSAPNRWSWIQWWYSAPGTNSSNTWLTRVFTMPRWTSLLNTAEKLPGLRIASTQARHASWINSIILFPTPPCTGM